MTIRRKGAYRVALILFVLWWVGVFGAMFYRPMEWNAETALLVILAIAYCAYVGAALVMYVIEGFRDAGEDEAADDARRFWIDGTHDR